VRAAWVSLLLVLVAPRAARADDKPLPELHLEYRVIGRAEGCPDESAFRRNVALRLGYDPFVGAEGGRRLSVVVKETSPRSVTVTLLDRSGKVAGRRVLAEPPSECAELTANAAFAASVAIDPTVLSRPDPAPSASAPPESAPPPSAPPPVVASKGPDAVTKPAATWTPSLRAGATGAFGLLPAAALGVAVSGALRADRWSVGLEGRFDLPNDAERTIAPSAVAVTVTTSLVSANAFACGHFGSAALVPYGCAALHVGALRGASSGIALPKEDVTPYVAVGPRVGVALSVTSGFAIDARLDVPFALTTAELRVDGRSVWTSPLAAAVIGAGATLNIP
jgi:hypothetical protein